MGVMIEICEDEIEHLAEGLDDMLHVGGKLMSCIEQMKEGGEQSRYGRRMGRYGRRDEDESRNDEPMMGNRRSRDAYGRYM